MRNICIHILIIKLKICHNELRMKHYSKIAEILQIILRKISIKSNTVALIIAQMQHITIEA